MPELQSATSDRIEMIKFSVITIFIFVTACHAPLVEQNKEMQSPTPKRELRKDIPNDSWVKIYFGETPGITRPGLDKVTRQNGFSILRENILPDNDLEVRFWVGFGLYGNDGLILKRDSGNWSAVNLRQMLCHVEEDGKDKRGKFTLEPPKSGWNTLWQKLIDAGVLTLPDSSKLKYEGGVLDGKGYVIETNYDYLYRTYHYPNPDNEKLKEAKQMIKIGEIIADEFGLESFNIKTGGCSIDE